jgi:hypothetical protein
VLPARVKALAALAGFLILVAALRVAMSPRTGDGGAEPPLRSPVVAPAAQDRAPAPSTTDSAPDPGPAPPSAGSGRIAGVVTFGRPDDEPAADVLVVLSRGPEGDRKEVARTRTDHGGRFAFEGLAAGEHFFSTRTLEGEPWDTEHRTAVLEPEKAAIVQLWVEKPLPAGTGVPVKGTVKYDDGRPVTEFRFAFSDDDEEYSVEGRDGVFELRLPRHGTYRVFSVDADGERWSRLFLEVEVIAGEEVDIVIPVPRALTLLAVDRGTGAPLPSARAYLHRSERDDFSSDDHPNRTTLEGEPLKADGEGRIAIGRGTESVTCYVVAEGRAWRKVEAERTAEGGLRVPLDPGGSVLLSVEGWEALQDASVTAVSAGPWRNWTLPVPGPDGKARYDGIPEGTWTFRVKRGPWFRDGEVYGAGEVLVIAGAEANLSVVTRPSSAGVPVPVSGTIAVPAAWGHRVLSVSFEGADPTNGTVRRMLRLEVPSDGSPVPFRLGPVPPGRYEVDVDPQWYTSITVPREGGTFDLRVPGPGEVKVRVVDDASGDPVEGAKVMWHSDVGRRGYGLDSAKRGEGPGEFLLRAPAGKVALTVSAPGFADRSLGGMMALLSPERDQSVEVREGAATTVVVRLRRSGAVKLVFQFEGPAPSWGDAHVMVWSGPRDSHGVGRGMSVKEGIGTCAGLEPGPYHVRASFPGDEFDDVEGHPVDVKAGETTEVRIQLVRKRE